jgi:hypothetical protein
MRETHQPTWDAASRVHTRVGVETYYQHWRAGQYAERPLSSTFHHHDHLKGHLKRIGIMDGWRLGECRLLLFKPDIKWNELNIRTLFWGALCGPSFLMMCMLRHPIYVLAARDLYSPNTVFVLVASLRRVSFCDIFWPFLANFTQHPLAPHHQESTTWQSLEWRLETSCDWRTMQMLLPFSKILGSLVWLPE